MSFYLSLSLFLLFFVLYVYVELHRKTLSGCSVTAVVVRFLGIISETEAATLRQARVNGDRMRTAATRKKIKPSGQNHGVTGSGEVGRDLA